MFINVCTSKQKNNFNNRNSSSEEMKHINEQLIDYKIISDALQKREKKPTVLSHILMLVKNKIRNNFTNTTFYFLQFFLPIFITTVTCYIMKSLTNDLPHLNVANLESFSKHYKLHTPLFYENLEKDSKVKDVLNLILEDYVDGTDLLNKPDTNAAERDLCCYKNNTSTCFVNEISKEQIDKCINKFPIISHRKENSYVQLIKSCDSNQFLIYSRFKHVYEQFNNFNI